MIMPERNVQTVACTSEKNEKLAFVAWRRLSRRTTLMCKALGAELWFFPDSLPYLGAAYNTFAYVRKNRPSVLLVQLPQGPLLLEALVLRAFFGCKIVADVHTGFLMQWEWKSYLLNAPFRNLLKYADIVLIHNNTMNELLSNDVKRKALAVYDPWQFIITISSKSNDDYVVFPASYHPDEPLEEILTCFQKYFPNNSLYITGDWRRRSSVKKYESKNIIFTGFLSAREYEDLIAGARAIISGTKEEYTALMSAWEAIAYLKPLAITDTRAVRDSYATYPVYYDWKDEKSISQAIDSILESSPGVLVREKLRENAANSLKKLASLISEFPNESG